MFVDSNVVVHIYVLKVLALLSILVREVLNFFFVSGEKLGSQSSTRGNKIPGNKVHFLIRGNYPVRYD